MADAFTRLSQHPCRPALQRVRLLSDREQQVLRLLGNGMSNRKIAEELGVTERTVKAHLGGIMAKLQVTSRLQAGLVALLDHLEDSGLN